MEIYAPACPWHIRIGELFVTQGSTPDKIWIGKVFEPEGGDFDAAQLYALLRKFYDENF